MATTANRFVHFNAGQKMQFWEIVVGCVAYLITGLIMWFPEVFGRILVPISYVVHDISALVMLFGIFFHVYLSTFGEPGTIQAMTRGTVSEAWAWTHHPAWYKAITGRDPQAALKQAEAEMLALEGIAVPSLGPAVPLATSPGEGPERWSLWSACMRLLKKQPKK